jgi:hypothetical protein
MSDEHGPIRQQRLLFAFSHRAVAAIASLVTALLVGLRAVCEWAMMREYGPDAQMAIWEMLFLVKLALWLLAGAIAAGLMIVMWPRRWGLRASMAALMVWAVAICHASWNYNVARQALADARNRQASPNRLSELVHFNGIQAGYELDNRLASNPTTPPEALRELSQRDDQSGTLMCLMRNPSTPDDVLEKIRDSRP